MSFKVSEVHIAHTSMYELFFTSSSMILCTILPYVTSVKVTLFYQFVVLACCVMELNRYPTSGTR